jgi:hypothetical protein
VGYPNLSSLRSIYWNEVPVLSEAGQFNFQNVSVAQTPGYANGQAIQVLSPFQTVSRSIGERLRGNIGTTITNSKTYRISNRDCRGVVVNVKLGQFYQRYISDISSQQVLVGSIIRTRVDYSIGYRPYFTNRNSPPFVIGKVVTIFGKLTSAGGYIRSDRIDFPANAMTDPSFIGWEIQISRSTPDSTTPDLVNATYVDSLTEIQGNIYTFPNSAVIRSLFDAEYFASVPERAFDTQLLKVKIPGNYNPILKSYSGAGFATTNGGWNGQFATGKAWTDNPAWCYYDLLTNRRYGLGKYIDTSTVDPTSLYEIGKYCDTLVTDGYGGLEPRFTCNVLLSSREEAYKVVNDMASAFLGMTYYANNSIFVSQDSPKTPLLTFTNANVEDGNFNYSSTSRKSRNSVAIVRFNDPKNFYRPSVEYVDDIEQIRKYGIREIELTAFGCASRGQAMRMGRWVLLSDKLEPESVNFIAGIGEAAYLRPGDVFKIHDTNRKLKRYGGRTVSIRPKGGNTTSEVVLDGKIDTEPTVEYKLSVITPTYNYNSSQVTGLNSNDSTGIRRSFIQNFYFSGSQSVASGALTTINLTGGFDYTNYRVTGQQTWMMELSERYASYTGSIYFASNSSDYYRVINIEEKEINKFNIIGMQYNSQKYGEIESGLIFQNQQNNKINIPSSPRNLSLNVYTVGTHRKTVTYNFMVDDPANIDSFQVFVKNDGPFVGNGVPGANYLRDTLSANTQNGRMRIGSRGEGSGLYQFRVYAFNAQQGILSPTFASGSVLINSVDPINSVIISNLRVDTTGYTTGSAVGGAVSVIQSKNLNPIFAWSVGSDDPYATTGTYKYMATVRPGVTNSRSPGRTVVFRQSGITSLNWAFSLANNLSTSGGPYRNYQVVVEAHSANGKTSAGNQIGSPEANTWHLFPNSYDIIQVSNPRQTGIEFSGAIPTRQSIGMGFSGITGKHESYVSMTTNGGINVEFTKGVFDADIVGGFLYASSGKFPKNETAARSGEWGTRGVKRSSFTFNPAFPSIHVPSAANHILSSPTIYASISFYDALDAGILAAGRELSGAVYMSNNVIIPSSATTTRLGLGTVNLYSVRRLNPLPGTPVVYTDGIVQTAAGIVDRSYPLGVSNDAASIWYSVIYMGSPLTEIPYTGIYQGDGATS